MQENELPKQQNHREEGAPSSPLESDTTPNTLKEGGPQGTWGPLVGVIIIVAILVLGGLYFWGRELVGNGEEPSAADIANQEDPQLQELREQDSSDDVSSIEADIEATDFSDIDQEFSDIEAEAGF